MGEQDTERAEIERILIRAQGMGVDPERVIRALGHRPTDPVEKPSVRADPPPGPS